MRAEGEVEAVIGGVKGDAAVGEGFGLEEG